MSFNLDSYETVKERKKRFYAAHPDGRILVQIDNEDIEEKALVRATIYLNREDHEKGLPRSHGYALEIRDKELSKNKYGKEFESVNFSSWVENCEESAVGRALDNAGFGSDKASRDEMQKAQRMSQVLGGQNTPNAQQQAPVASSSGIMPFGKTKGTPLEKLPTGEIESALVWARSKNKFAEFQLEAAAELKRRQNAKPKKEEQEIPDYIQGEIPF